MNKASSIFITLLMMLWSCNTGQPQADEEQDGGIRGEVDYEEATADSVRTEDINPVDVMDQGFEREGDDEPGNVPPGGSGDR